MSGPKVVRVVTREELEAICSRLISQVRAAAAELLRTLKRSELLTSELETDIEARIDALSVQLRAGQFAALQRSAPTVTAFFRSEKHRYQQIAIANAEAQRKQRQQLIDAASSVAGALRQQSKPVPPALDAVISRARSARIDDIPGLRAEVDSAFKALVGPSKGPVIAMDFATRLAGGLEQQSLADWLNRQPRDNAIPDRLIKLMSELEVIEDGEVVTAFVARFDAVDQERRLDRRRLLMDSLALDISAALNRRRQLDDSRATLLNVDAELALLSGAEASEMRARITGALTGTGPTETADLVGQARTLIDTRAAQAAATSRRRAVLSGLAGLGYEVREGMETAWARDGSIVVAKPGTDDYGVELGGPADASRLQVRVVGAENPVAPRSQQRDVEQEGLWCSEVDELVASLDRRGAELTIERALAVGAQPLKNSSAIGRKTRVGATEDDVAVPKARAKP